MSSIMEQESGEKALAGTASVREDNGAPADAAKDVGVEEVNS